MRIQRMLTVLGLSFVIIILAACGSEAESGEESSEAADGKSVDMGQISWAENIAVTNMWKVILEERGYDVEFHLLDMGTTMAALANDELDIGLEVWLPVQDQNYLQEYKDEVDFSEETWFDEAKVGLVVPEYVEVDSVEELNDNADLFDHEIVGFDPGAGTMEVTEDLIDVYELDYELLPSSEPAMVTEVLEAVAAEKPIVAPLWSPHRIFSEVDLKYLEDPQEVYGGVEKIHHATRQGFSDDYPELDTWFKNWKMNDEEIGSLMSEVDAAEEPLDGAKQWVEENEDLIAEWLDE